METAYSVVGPSFFAVSGFGEVQTSATYDFIHELGFQVCEELASVAILQVANATSSLNATTTAAALLAPASAPAESRNSSSKNCLMIRLYCQPRHQSRRCDCICCDMLLPDPKVSEKGSSNNCGRESWLWTWKWLRRRTITPTTKDGALCGKEETRDEGE